MPSISSLPHTMQLNIVTSFSLGIHGICGPNKTKPSCNGGFHEHHHPFIQARLLVLTSLGCHSLVFI